MLLPGTEGVQVGFMCSAPAGPGLEATFSELKLELG